MPSSPLLPLPSPLLTLQEKQKKDAAAAAANGKTVKQSAGELRLQKGAWSRGSARGCLEGEVAAPRPRSQPPLPCTPTTPSLPPSHPPADLSELDLPKSVAIRFPDGADKIMSFEVTLRPDEGLYK